MPRTARRLGSWAAKQLGSKVADRENNGKDRMLSVRLLVGSWLTRDGYYVLTY